ncbi:hypothetical protein BRLA_c041490 [Brevibacillus laterosporus LMG 15441]|uniref:Uncharacterized protein n=1 Tax=Brevibacillus laterosporus LMG 15441 TaxID=1042163 RepID=A0A075R974_BRELA|nr:hypothetical protein BRLA_c041490 [Brevibacillus laterosporus LMG 15441]
MSEHVYKIVGAPSKKITALRTKYNFKEMKRARWKP